jgi:hypothetical protein
MTDAESPATLFELLYLFFPEEPMRIVYDNGCNFLSYALNRDPAWTAILRAFVDALHFKGHTSCAKSFDTGVGRAHLLLLCVLDLHECMLPAIEWITRNHACQLYVYSNVSLPAQAHTRAKRPPLPSQHQPSSLPRTRPLLPLPLPPLLPSPLPPLPRLRHQRSLRPLRVSLFRTPSWGTRPLLSRRTVGWPP